MTRRLLVGLVLGLVAAIAACGGSETNAPDAPPLPIDARVIDGPPPSFFIDSFAANPATVPRDTTTMVTFSWALAGSISGVATCSIDQGIGPVTGSSVTRAVTLTADTVYTMTCTDSIGSRSAETTITTRLVAPVLGTFTANPTSVTTGVATAVTWSWTYSNTPTPAPSCAINNGVGAVTSGASTTVTQNLATTYTLSCTNSEGTATRTVNVGVVAAPVAPVLGSFTATPSSVTMNAATSVTFAWTYANSPTPAPTCSIDQGLGAITSGSARTLTLAADATYTLTCTNSAGSVTGTRTIVVTPPVAPQITAFAASPATVTTGVATSVTFTWSYATTPAPAPTCSIDQGIGAISNGNARTLTLNAATTYTLTCVNSGGSSTAQLTIGTTPPVAPQLATFTATPAFVRSGVASSVRWDWTYANTPTPAPACSIDQGVGGISNGGFATVTQSADRTYTLTCTNAGGSSTAIVLVKIAVAPQIGTFTASPSTIPYNTTASVTWTYTFANVPEPAPVCSIEHGIGTISSGQSSTLSLTASRVFRITCTNLGGTATAEATVNVDECAANVDRCDANATCTDLPVGYACACTAAYFGDGYTCGARASCDVQPSLCAPNATCATVAGGHACVCNAGFVGNGTSCARLRLAFTTSTSGTADLASWPDAGGLAGLAGADAVCNARAAAAGLPGTYVAWLSVPTVDAYCRVHGLTGTKAARCGQAVLPATAGPWVRPDGRPFAPAITQLLEPTRQVLYPASLTELGAPLATTARVWSGTEDTGVYKPAFGEAGVPCSSWTAASGLEAVTGYAHGGPVGWTEARADLLCSGTAHLRCLEVAAGAGPGLPPLPVSGRRAFLTSVSGTGNLSTWSDANGATGLAAADQVCRARARYAGLPNANAFDAWMSTSASSAATRITSSGTWQRPDGVVIANDRVDLLDGTIGAALIVTELVTYVMGATSLSFSNWWTGTTATGGASSSTCSSWTTASSSTFGGSGRAEGVDASWTTAGSSSCNAVRPMFCFED